MESPLGKSVEFLRDFGFFDIVLPFLLTFTLTFAILEKTAILGKTRIDKDTEIPNKNLNAMVAFVFGLLVVATANVVRAINESLPNVILLVVISVSFLILIGTFWTSPMDFPSKHKNFYLMFVILMFIGVILIFLNSIYFNYLGEEVSVLEYSIDYVTQNWSGAVFGSIIILIVIIVSIVAVMGGFGGRNNGKKED